MCSSAVRHEFHILSVELEVFDEAEYSWLLEVLDDKTGSLKEVHVFVCKGEPKYQ